jgi:hypothetical protein
MWFNWRQFDTGWGELLCFVAAWALGLAGLWADYSARTQPATGDSVAVTGGRAPSNDN